MSQPIEFILGQKQKNSGPTLPAKGDLKKIPKPIREEAVRLLEKQAWAIVPSLGLIEAPAYIESKSVGSAALAVRRHYGQLAKVLADYGEAQLNLGALKAEVLRNALVGLNQGSYRYDYKKKSKPFNCHLVGIKAGQKKAVREAEVLGHATHLCRDLVNTPAEDLGPAEFEAVAKRECKKSGLKVTTISAAEAKKKGMNALLAVGRASHRAPRMLVIEYSGKGSSKDFLALCGKGVCFDTGGLNVKPGNSMLLMRKDMGGAATVLAAMLALAQLKAKTKIRAYIPLVENAIGPNAFRMGDIFTACDGQTIEIGHTDAEGRVILADAIAYAKKQGASQIVSVATLTGAAMVALGRMHVPIMGEDKLIRSIEKGAKSSGEKVWRLPMDEDHRGMVRGKVADWTNADGSGEAGCITAGAFLACFAGDTPFAHCDISPACWKPASHALGPAGATGVLVTTLVDAFKV